MSDSDYDRYRSGVPFDWRLLEDRCIEPVIPSRPPIPWPKHGLDGRYKETKEYLRRSRERDEQQRRDLEDYKAAHKAYLECLEREHKRMMAEFNAFVASLPKQR